MSIASAAATCAGAEQASARIAHWPRHAAGSHGKVIDSARTGILKNSECMKTKNYSVKCWLGADMCQVYFKYMTNAKKAYETISATMEYDRVQLIKLENGEETNLSTTTKEEEQ